MTTTSLVHPTHDPDLLQRLTDLETAHVRQLQSLPDSGLDAVSSARRARTERGLHDVRAALARLGEGRYGICTGCQQPISPERLELRCWSTTCVGCADRA